MNWEKRLPHRHLGESPQTQTCKKSFLLPATAVQTRWQRVKASLLPYLRKSKKLAMAYTESQVEKAQNEARMISEQADEIESRKCLTQQEEVKEFCCTVDSIFADDGLPPVVKALKLAKLMEKNPRLLSQLEKVRDVLDKMSRNELLGK